MPGAFASAEELLESTGLVVDRSRAQAVLAAASDLIRAECAQELSIVVDDVVALEAQPSPVLLLPERPVTEVTLVQVLGSAITDFSFQSWGKLERSNDVFWTDGATVTYSHGYAPSDWEHGVFRQICIDSATRALSLNDRSASEALGSTLMESAGFSPEVFLTDGEKLRLTDFGKVLIG